MATSHGLLLCKIYLRIKERLSLQAATWQRTVSGAKDMFSRPRLIGVPSQVTPYQGLPHSRGLQPLVALMSGTKLPGAENEQPRSQLSAQQVTHQPQIP